MVSIGRPAIGANPRTKVTLPSLVLTSMGRAGDDLNWTKSKNSKLNSDLLQVINLKNFWTSRSNNTFITTEVGATCLFCSR